MYTLITLYIIIGCSLYFTALLPAKIKLAYVVLKFGAPKTSTCLQRRWYEPGGTWVCGRPRHGKSD